MLDKLCAAARAVAIVLSLVAGFVPGLGFDVALALVVLGVVTGIGYGSDVMIRLGVIVLALPVAGAALGHLPMVGPQLGAVMVNIALCTAAAMGSGYAIVLFNAVKKDLATLTG